MRGVFMSRWNLSKFLLPAFFAALATPSFAETPIWSVEETLSALEKDEVLLLDIRSRDEWKETGLARGSLPISMHEQGFGKRLQEVFNLGKPVALICATGGRTAHVISILEKNGIKDVIDVSEGMMGNKRGSGWIAKRMPIVDIDTATAEYQRLISN